MSVSLDPSLVPGNEEPSISLTAQGLSSQHWAARAVEVNAPMGPGRGLLPPGLVYTRAFGSNVFYANDNRYVDLAAGFGAMLLGHCHPELTACVADQASKLTLALGDVFPSTEKIVLQEALAKMVGPEPHRVILGQSCADAITAALKTAVLATDLPGVIAFSGAYHGLSYAPLALCGLRTSYKVPFANQLNSHIHNVPYPSNSEEGHQSLSEVARLLAAGDVGAVVIEPILGRGGCVIAPDGFLFSLVELTRKHGAISIFDEIWTGLGRSGSLLYSRAIGVVPDIICLGKGLGGGLPLSACIGRAEVMQAWQSDDEVVHTSTFAGNPLACATALCLLRILERDGIVEQTLERGKAWIEALLERLSSLTIVRELRGRGFMVAIDLGPKPGIAAEAAHRLLSRGWIASTGGGSREVLILTPPLTISDQLLASATNALYQSLSELRP
jgi:4-aminobutyrate aminotransferase/(S)-3-amino-2-methylpropionate transaminase